MERDEWPVFCADVRDDQAGLREGDVDRPGEEGRRQDGHDRHGPDDEQNRSDSSGLEH